MIINMNTFSIITPCHNSGAFIERLLDSVLQQTYPSVEMITVDNDSKDDTGSIINKYIPIFEKKGYSLHYIKEGDLGPSCAVKNALHMVTGDYLCVPDSDDFFAVNDYLERMVTTLESLSPDYGMIRCYEQELLEGNLTKLDVIGEKAKDDNKETMFVDCLLGSNGYYYPGVGYIYKMKVLKETIRNLEIYGAYNIGQNRQLMLPILYSYKCYTLKEPLVNYLVRKSSISHGDYAKYHIKQQIYAQEDTYITTILNSIIQINEKDIRKYRNLYLFSCARLMAHTAMRNGEYSEALKYFSQGKMYGTIKRKEYIFFGCTLLKAQIKVLLMKIGFIKKLIERENKPNKIYY